jgi:hypothetical protein
MRTMMRTMILAITIYFRVYQIQKFRFALSVKCELVDEKTKLASSMIVVEVVLHNGAWKEKDNNRTLRPLPPSASKTVVAFNIKSMSPKREEEEDEEDENKPQGQIYQ